jgi:hypothetical protein
VAPVAGAHAKSTIIDAAALPGAGETIVTGPGTGVDWLTVNASGPAHAPGPEAVTGCMNQLYVAPLASGVSKMTLQLENVIPVKPPEKQRDFTATFS